MTDTSFPRVRSSLLSQFPNVRFIMSTRQGESPDAPFGFNLGLNVGDDSERVEKNLQRFYSGLGLDAESVASMKQVHGTTIRTVTEPGVYEDTDAIVTQTCLLGLAVRVADCVPLVLYAPGDNLIAAVHAGWKGTAEHIAAKTVEYMKREFGVDPETVLAYLGPSAGACCYEIQEDVAGLFPESVLGCSSSGKATLDLRGANIRQLKDIGLSEVNIEADSSCTICNTAFFHSHRRDGETSGRMLAAICMVDEAT